MATLEPCAGAGFGRKRPQDPICQGCGQVTVTALGSDNGRAWNGRPARPITMAGPVPAGPLSPGGENDVDARFT